MKISVITPVYNGETMIRYCMDSVDRQGYPDKEHIIVDGLSSDGTVAVIQKNAKEHVRLLSEKDQGLYDAFNKGINLAQGDVICFLCADDMYAHENALQSIANAFQMHPEADMIYGDVIYVNRKDLTSVTRYWQSSSFSAGLFKKGWMAPNTALFIKRELFKRWGAFSLKYRVASDYELQFRFFEKHKLRSVYVPGILVQMRSGGMSNSGIANVYKSLKECYQALKGQKVQFPLVYIINILFYRLRQTVIPLHVREFNRKQMNAILQMEVGQAPGN